MFLPGSVQILALTTLMAATGTQAAGPTESASSPDDTSPNGTINFHLEPNTPTTAEPISEIFEPSLQVGTPPDTGLSTEIPELNRLVERRFKIEESQNGGRTANVDLPEQGFSLRMYSASGNEGYMPGMHLLTASLDGQNAWRRQVDLSIDPSSFDEVDLKVRASTYSERRPLLFGANVRHGVGDFSRWRENNSWDIGLEFRLPNSGLSYSGGFGWGEYSFSDQRRMDGNDNLLFFRPKWERGNSSWHRLDANVLNANGNKISAYANYGWMDDDYRNYRRSNDSPLVFEGRTVEFGGEGNLGKVKFSMSNRSVDGPDIGMDETSGKLGFGAINLRLKTGQWIIRDRDLAAWSISDRFWDGTLDFDLKKSLSGRFTSGLLPSKLTLKVHKKNGAERFTGFLSQWKSSKMQVGLSWSGHGAESAIFLGRSNITRPIATLDGFSRKQETSIDFSHFRYGDWWDVTVYGAINSADEIGSASRFLSGGASLSMNAKMLPKLSMGIDANGYRMRSSGYAYRSRGVSVHSTLDFSKLLWETKAIRKPYLLLKAYGDWTSDEGFFEYDDQRSEPTVMLVFGAQF